MCVCGECACVRVCCVCCVAAPLCLGLLYGLTQFICILKYMYVRLCYAHTQHTSAHTYTHHTPHTHSYIHTRTQESYTHHLQHAAAADFAVVRARGAGEAVAAHGAVLTPRALQAYQSIPLLLCDEPIHPLLPQQPLHRVVYCIILSTPSCSSCGGGV